MASRGGGSRPEEEGGPPEATATQAGGGAAASPGSVPRATVLGNCARCGSGDKLKFCARCQAVRYCGRECQTADVSERGEGRKC